MMWIEVTILALLCGVVAIVDSSPVVCETEHAERCLDPFHEHLDKGVAELASLDDQDLAVACRKYEVASKCVSYFLYICSDVKAKYKSKLDEFEYACSHFTIKDKFWPFMGNLSEIVNNSRAEMLKNRAGLELSTAMKASMAAIITFFFIMLCCIAELWAYCERKAHLRELRKETEDEPKPKV